MVSFKLARLSAIRRKVLDGTSVNGKSRFFYAALSNVEYTITVTDTQTGTAKTYFNPQGQLASVADTAAF